LSASRAAYFDHFRDGEHIMAERPKKQARRPGRKSRQPASPLASPATQPTALSSEASSPTPAFPIVGIGASAGGLEAFTQLLHHIPATTGLAFILVQHLDPTHESVLPELLSRVTRMPVQQVQRGMIVEPNHIYVTPPNANMSMNGMTLTLTSRSETRGLHMPIDHFLRSLAEQHGSRAVGIILSGAGSDGALGLAEIKERGGITFVQDERTARFPAMPHSAVMQGGIDFILPPAAIAEELVRIARHPYVISSPSGHEEDPPPDPPPTLESSSQNGLGQIFRLLRSAKGVDFTCYKQSTIRRRITRRMTLRKMDALEKYAQYLRAHSEELDALYHDLLIKVTGFFRDPETFEALKSEVFPAIMRDRPANRPVRIWVPGCASGEECYSIAICLLEFLDDRIADTPIQIFATDIDEIALAKARSGRYIENIALDISPERLRRFFTKVDQHYQVMHTIRELCTFAKHDLCRDPPFSNLDLISCRNVLIYLEPAMQKRVIPLFHYALNSHGYLALGISESIGSFSDLFAQVDKKQKVFTKRVTAVRPAIEFPLPVRAAEQTATNTAGGGSMDEHTLKGVDVYHEADRIVLNHYAPAGVLLNEQMDILQFRGDTSHFLRPASGRASFNLLQMAREGLLMDLRSALTQAQKGGGTVERQGVRLRFEGKLLNVTIRVIPLSLPSPLASHYVILFEEAGPAADRNPRPGTRLRGEARREAERERNNELAQELEATKQYLQSIIERYEAANEELKSANEEILSSNEELQSTNEELETAKEELQSTNEELSTVNDELRQRNQELGEANNDLNNLFSSANLPIIVLASDLRIRRFTAAAEQALNVIPTDIGRPIGHLNLNIPIPDLEALIVEAMDTNSIKEREVQDHDGHWYSLRIRPYRTADNRIDGAMLIFIDIDSYKNVDRLTSLLAEVNTARQFAEAVVQKAPWPLLILDRELRVIRANPAFYAVFETSSEATEQQFISTLGDGQWDIPELRRLLRNVIPHNTEFHDFVVTREFPNIGEKTVLVTACPIRGDEQATATILLGIKDITEYRQSEARIAAALRDKEVLLREVYHRVKNNLQIVSSLLGLQADAIMDETARSLFQESQQRIQAMALVHQRLYASVNLTNIDTNTYLQSLIEDLSRMYDPEGRIASDIRAEGEMNLDTAVPCGLILTELISNTFKYAFPEAQPGRISVSLEPEAEDRWLLVVQDNGIGIPSDLDIAHTGTLGLTLVHDLVSQLRGDVQLDRSQGTTFRIHFRSAQSGGT
jgi:two-component system, chemotaxis family, CheB/CheR fusion protein